MKRIAVLLASNKIGGDARVAINLIEGLAARGVEVDLLLADSTQAGFQLSAKNVRVINLQVPLDVRASSTVKLLPALIKYLQHTKPKVLLSNLIFTNAIVTLSKFFTFPAPKLILVEHLALSSGQRLDEPQSKLLPTLIRVLYPRVDRVVCVSQQLEAQFREDYRLRNVMTIANPVVSSHLIEQSKLEIDHPWLNSDLPVFLGVGRFTAQKDFTTLIQAFSIVRQAMPAKLIILGDGELRSRLEAQIRSLDLQDDIDLPGFDTNPYRYMSRAAAFVLSSRWEALPTVLIESMACGCQVIATRCTGVTEILSDGEFGQMIPIADSVSMASAMKNAIDNPISPTALRMRAHDFSIDRAVDRYLELF